METEAVPVRIEVRSTQRDYAVLIGSGLLARIDRLPEAQPMRGPRIVVSTPPIWRRYEVRLGSLAGDSTPVLMADGERAKTLRTVSGLYESFAAARADRRTTIVAFGGGVVGDVAGFAAATYLRGLPLVQVPTTLLAQVDSSIGGKVGVNLPSGKNLVGAFYPPTLVLIDPDLLATLPRRELRAGMYEVVKYGVIASRALFDRLDADLASVFSRKPAVLESVVAECCRIKAGVVERDERESGPRRVLNYGHTVGHALEAVTNYRRFKHGEAVAYGMLAAARLSVMRGAMSADDEARLQGLITRMGPLPAVADLRVPDVLEAISRDKKVAEGRLHFVICAGLGEATIVSDVTPSELTAAVMSLGLSA
jgi:3-dehydroquinate synthase